MHECRQWAVEYCGKFSETLFNNTVDSLRHVFDLAVKRGLIAHNPAIAIEKVRVPQKELGGREEGGWGEVVRARSFPERL